MKTFLLLIIAINVLSKEIKVFRYTDGDLVVNSEDYIKISGTVLYTINDKGKGTVNFYGMDMNTMIPFATFSRVNIVYDDGENFSLSSYCEYGKWGNKKQNTMIGALGMVGTWNKMFVVGESDTMPLKLG